MTIEEIANRHGGLPDKELEIHTLREEVQRLTGERFKLRQQNAEYIEALREAKEQNEELKNAFMDIWECFGEPGIPNIDYIENAVNKVVEKYMP